MFCLLTCVLFISGMFKWIFSNPLKSLALWIVGVPTGDFILRMMAEKRLQVPMYKKLVTGSKPLVLIADDT